MFLSGTTGTKSRRDGERDVKSETDRTRDYIGWGYSMFKIHCLPARFGDSFWITYGSARKQYRILVDGGTSGTRNEIVKLIKQLPENDRRIDLAVVTHIDNDHIGGILSLLERNEFNVQFKDFWFNDRIHLPESPGDLLGVKQGIRLADQLTDHKIPWNKHFGGGSVQIPNKGALPKFELPGGMSITLLSPTINALARLAVVWDEVLEEQGLLSGQPPLEDDVDLLDLGGDEFLDEQPLPDINALAMEPFHRDDSEANGSSIAFLLEFKGKRVLMTGDAHADKMISALDRISPKQKLTVDLLKVSHHGSQGTTNRELLEKLDCSQFAITTNGSNFGHPDHETIARILKAHSGPKTLHFNYRSRHNEIWDDKTLKRNFRYDASYAPSNKNGLVIDLMI